MEAAVAVVLLPYHLLYYDAVVMSMKGCLGHKYGPTQIGRYSEREGRKWSVVSA